nr:LysR family transcriptional regulator [uncultured Sphaerochaeta sp.]
MDMVGLKYFLSAASLLNFTRAAEECCITQTAMSLHIAKMEKELGFQLFHRNHRTVSLTPGGSAFQKEAETILSLYNEGVQRSAAVASGYEGVLRIGFTNYIECSFLPELINSFRERYPHIEIILNKNPQPETLADLKNGRNDITVVFPYDTMDNDDLNSISIGSYEICAVLHRSHPLAGRNKISLNELSDDTFILYGSSKAPKLFRQVQKDWQSCSFSPRSIMETDSADGILFLVEAGFGNSLLPSYIRQIRNDQIRVIDLEDNHFSVEITIAYSRNNTNPSLELFLSALEEFPR